MILALDTSTDDASVAISRDGQPQAEVSWLAGGHHSRCLMAVLRQAMTLGGAAPADFTAVAVAIGPGSFNGIRVGLSSAKGLALALAIPLVGISTLDVIAFQVAEPDRGVLATVPAGRGEICCARYQLQGTDLLRNTDYVRLEPGAALDLLKEGDIVAGPGSEATVGALSGAAARFTVVHPARSFRRSSFLAELARRYFDAGGENQVDDVEPLYLRRPSAEERRSSAGRE
jgi:tRNA threonylcarbamoyladenosine biosynthesis protein TsaB